MQSSSAPSTTGEASSASSRGSSSGPFVQPDQQSSPWYNDAARPSQNQSRRMIGPAPNFYNSNEAPAQDNPQHYQRWVDYVGQQQQTSQDPPLDHSFDQFYFQHATYEQLGGQTQQPYPHPQSRGYGAIYGGLVPMTEGGAPSPSGHSAQHTSYGGTPEPTYQPPPTQPQPPAAVQPRAHHQPKPSYPIFPNQLAQPVFHGVGPQFERRAHATSDKPEESPSTSASWATDARQKKNTPSNTQAPRTRELPPPKTNRIVSAPSKATPPQKPSALTPAADAGDAAKKRKWNDVHVVNASAEPEGGSGDESDEYDIRVEVPGSSSASRKRGKAPRLPGACTHCKKLKMKCDFAGGNTCKRCKAGNHVCVVEGRRPRTMPNKREYLLAQIRQKDAIIESLLKQLHNPYLATPLSIESYRMATSPSDSNKTNILAWLDRLTASVREPKKPDMSLFDGLTRVSPEVDSDEEPDTANTSKIPGLKQDDDDEADLSPTLETPPNALPELHVPFKLMEAMSLDRQRGERKKKSKDDGEFKDDENVGIANDSYFKPGDLGRRSRLIEQHNLPEIIVHGLVKPDDVEKLFGIFYERVNPFISLLDPVLHTSHTTFARCPFLFTVICAISSRYYSEKSEIYPIAMHFAKHSAANALIDGWKSVELCQAYILMSIYAVPARRWEEDRSWLYTGLAIRIATDLNLHQVSTVKPQSERQEREILNKRRVWMICFNLDRSTATQFGKPSTIKEDYIVRSAKDWYKHSQYNHKYDIHLCAHSALLQIVAKFHDEIFSDSSSPSGLNKKVNFRSVTLAHDEHLRRYHEEWAKRFEEESDPNDPACVFRCSLLPFLVAYSRLVMFSFGFQQAYHRGLERGDEIFYTTCLQAAKTVIQTMLDQLAPSGYMKYAPDGHFVFASFASAFLLKLLRPEFSSFSGAQEQETEIFELIGRLIETLSSTKIAIDDRHTPKLYARFLLNLLSRHRRDGTFVGQLRTNPPPRLDSSMSDSTQQSQTGVSRYPVNMGLQDMSHTMHYGGAMGGGQQDFSEALMAAAGELKFVTEFDAASGLGIGAEEDMHLHTLEAITNPGWWANMMMPGFSWPEPTPSPPANVPQQHANMNMHGLQPTYGIFHTSPQVLI